MAQPIDPNLTADDAPADRSLDAGLAAAFGPASHSLAGASVLEELRHAYGELRPVLLRDAGAEGSAHVVRPHSTEMPQLHETGARYQLAGEIARGGMGAVLRGRDVDLGRDLAVKVLLEKHANNPTVAQRFVEEAQVGAQLQHPGIVPVYELGRFGDRPYFTMKLVKGRTLSALLSERTELAEDRPRYLGVFHQVCQTVAYAHAKGVIHRDLKPANVMVGAFGEVQVMDWGLAKVLPEGGVADEERTINGTGCRPPGVEPTVIRTARSGSGGSVGSDTEAGSLMGTPAYMPPEQANGEVERLDRRTDVFGLGAVLCEILTGQPPYVGRSADEVRRKAANGDQAEMLARLGASGADAELLALAKGCLAPEAIDRPRDAKAVADDLADYLHGVDERLRRTEIERAEAVVRAAEERKLRRVQVALAASVLLALGLAGGGGLWVQQQRTGRAVREAAVEAEIAAALREAERYQEQARYAEARAAVSRAEGLLSGGGAALAERVVVARADLDMLAKLDDIRLLQSAVDVDRNQFDASAGVPLYAAAFRNYGIAVEELDPAEAAQRIRGRAIRVALVAALDDWAHVAGAGEKRDRLTKLAQATDPESGGPSGQLRQALARKDRDALVRLAAEDAMTRLSPAQLIILARNLTALKALEEAAELLRRAQQRHPDDFWINLELANTLYKLQPLRVAEAIGFYRAALALRPDNPGVFLNLGSALLSNRDTAEAIAALRRAIELAPNYAKAHSGLGNALSRRGALAGAIAAFQKAIELNPNDARAYTLLGGALGVSGDFAGAVAAYRKVIELEPNNATAHTSLGLALRLRGDDAGAIAAYRKVVELRQKEVALDPNNAMTHLGLGNALQRSDDLAGAIAAFQKAIELNPNSAIMHVGLGNALSQGGDAAGAVAAYRKASELEPKNALRHHRLGRALEQSGDDAGAVTAYQKVIELGPNDAEAHGDLGSALRRQGRFAESLAAIRRGHDLGSQTPSWTIPSAQRVQMAERLVVAESKLEAVVRGTAQPADDAERAALAEVCYCQQMYPASARLYAEAFAGTPALADDLGDSRGVGHRYYAACAAAGAGCGQGADSVALDKSARAKLRGQALDWLRADQEAWANKLASGSPSDRNQVRWAMQKRLLFQELACVRGDEARAKLPADEREAWAQLWADVADLERQAASDRK